MYYDYGSTYGSSYGGLFGAYSTVAGLVGLAIAILAIVAMWKIFEKAGKAGWISIVPFYNLYTLFEITWGNGWYFLLIFLAIIPILGYIAVLVIVVMTMVKLAKAFGKSTGFALGLIFLSVIFYAILAFDSSTYLGVPGKETSTPNPNPQPTAPPVNDQTATPAANFCKNCGTKLEVTEAFCHNCGTPKSN